MAAIGEPDETLMARTATGDRACLELLVRRHATPLLTFLARMAGDRHRGEELFQEVFLAVWVKRRQYQHPRPFKPWLYAIAVNKCRAAFRLRPAWSAPLTDDGPAAAGLRPSTGRKTTRTCGAYLRQSRATEVVLYPQFESSRQVLRPFIERHAEAFERVYANPEFTVYRIRECAVTSR